MQISAASAVRLNADLFAAASQPESKPSTGFGKLAIDDCGSVPIKFKFPPPPPPPLGDVLGGLATSSFQLDDDWCGTVPHKFPFPPPPAPWTDIASQLPRAW